MARTTTTKVKQIVTTSIADSVVSSTFIPIANEFVDHHLGEKGLTETLLTNIELYVAAHFVAISEERGGLKSTEVGEAEEQLSDIHQGGLAMTRYGQQAIALDHTDTLSTAIVEQKTTTVRYTVDHHPDADLKSAMFSVV